MYEKRGRRVGGQKCVYQKWPNQIFPKINFLFFPRWSLCSGGGGGPGRVHPLLLPFLAILILPWGQGLRKRLIDTRTETSHTSVTSIPELPIGTFLSWPPRTAAMAMRWWVAVLGGASCHAMANLANRLQRPCSCSAAGGPCEFKSPRGSHVGARKLEVGTGGSVTRKARVAGYVLCVCVCVCVCMCLCVWAEVGMMQNKKQLTTHHTLQQDPSHHAPYPRTRHISSRSIPQNKIHVTTPNGLEHLTTLPNPAYPYHPAHPSFPLVVCASRAPGLSLFHDSVLGPHRGGQRPLARWSNGGYWALGCPLAGSLPLTGAHVASASCFPRLPTASPPNLCVWYGRCGQCPVCVACFCSSRSFVR